MSRPVRASGLLLHITSLPSAFGVGDLGPAAHAFARLLAGAGQTVWQFLPVTPTSTFIGNSPYSSPSAFAGNTLLVSPERLAEDGFVSWADVDAGGEQFRDVARGTVCFEAVEAHRRALLRAAWERNRHQLAVDTGYLRFCRGNAHWLDDYARFVVLKERFGGAAWTTWDEPFARRHPDALALLDTQEAAALDHVRFCQYLFFRQWYDLRAACTELGVRLVGDVRIYVTHDSADVWANPGYFRLAADFAPTHVAGVPPDYFSATGSAGATRCTIGTPCGATAFRGGCAAWRTTCAWPTSCGWTTFGVSRGTGKFRRRRRRPSTAAGWMRRAWNCSARWPGGSRRCRSSPRTLG